MGLLEPKWPQLALSNWTLKVYWEPRAGLYTTCDTLLGPGKLALLELELVTLTLLLASFLIFPTFKVVSNPEFDDWSLVLTTSRGQVTIAPVVPPTLK